MRDAAETGFGLFFAALFAASVGAFVLLRHPASAARRDPTAPEPPRSPTPTPGPNSPPAPGPAIPAPSSTSLLSPAAAAGMPLPLPDVPLGPPGFMPPGVDPWRPYIEYVAKFYPGVPTGLVSGWIAEESGGNQCAVGFPGECDAQGQVLESGLFQLMSPHDISLAGTTVAEMRACCGGPTHFQGLTRAMALPSASAENKAKVNAARAAEQACTKPLTEAQRIRAVQVGFVFITRVMAIVDQSFARYGRAWSRGTPDYWQMVKAYHAGSGLPTAGLDASIAGRHGQVPTSWAEYKQGLWDNPAVGHQWDHLLSNAERGGAEAFPHVNAGV